jgi:hypothetical protein
VIRRAKSFPLGFRQGFEYVRDNGDSESAAFLKLD